MTAVILASFFGGFGYEYLSFIPSLIPPLKKKLTRFSNIKPSIDSNKHFHYNCKVLYCISTKKIYSSTKRVKVHREIRIKATSSCLPLDLLSRV